MEPKTKRDCYSEITNAIIADLEKGVRPWVGGCVRVRSSSSSKSLAGHDVVILALLPQRPVFEDDVDAARLRFGKSEARARAAFVMQ